MYFGHDSFLVVYVAQLHDILFTILFFYKAIVGLLFSLILDCRPGATANLSDPKRSQFEYSWTVQHFLRGLSTMLY